MEKTGNIMVSETLEWARISSLPLSQDEAVGQQDNGQIRTYSRHQTLTSW